jgi:hypothetical protein
VRWSTEVSLETFFFAITFFPHTPLAADAPVPFLSRPQSPSHIVSMAFTNATVFLYLARSFGRNSESGPKSCTKA